MTLVKFKITYDQGNPAARTGPTEITAARITEAGHEGRWLEFSDGSGTIVLVRSAHVVRVERDST
jgi:hypothetical protein